MRYALCLLRRTNTKIAADGLGPAAAPRRSLQHPVSARLFFRRPVPDRLRIAPCSKDDAGTPTQPTPETECGSGCGPDANETNTRGRRATLLVPEQSNPSSFAAETTIAYRVEATGRVRLRIYDLLGRHVETLVDAQLPPDTYAVTFDARTLACGTYLYRLETAAGVETLRVTLVERAA